MQHGILVDAVNEEHRVISQRGLNEASAPAACVGGIQDGHRSISCKELPGCLHIGQGDFLTHLAPLLVLRGVETRFRRPRGRQFAAQFAVVENLRVYALTEKGFPDTPGES